MTERLFSEIDFSTLWRDRFKQAISVIDSLGDRIRSISNDEIDEVCQSIEGQFGFDLASLVNDEIDVDPQPAKVDVRYLPSPRIIRDRSRPLYVDGTIYTVRIPYVGDRDTFRIKPNTWDSLGPPQAHSLTNKHIISVFKAVSEMEHEIVGREIPKYIEQLSRWLGYVGLSVGSPSLYHEAKQEIFSRKQRLSAGEVRVQAMGFKLRHRDDAPPNYKAPLERKKITSVSLRPRDSVEREPSISDDDYEAILNVITNMTEVIERSPDAFRSLGEEDLRFHFLVQLNGQYEGQATGETFNFDGKTDILVRVGDRSVFIAECKFWKGERQLLDTVDQILGYLSWRDTKTAIILFNRNKNLTAVLDQIPTIIASHPAFEKHLGKVGETQFRFRLKHPEDRKRQLLLAILVFDVPIKMSGSDDQQPN